MRVLSEVPLSAANVARVGRTLLACYQSNDEANALPLAVDIEVTGAAGAPLMFDAFARLYDPIRPVYLSLSGETLLAGQLPRMVAHATAAGSRVDIVTNARLLDAGRAYALVEAGLAELKVAVDTREPEEAVLRNIERLVALRDANRRSSPRIEIQWTLSPDTGLYPHGQPNRLVELCHRRFTGIEPTVRVAGTRFGDPEVLAELHRARILGARYGFRRTVGSLDGAILQLTRNRARASCYVPWYACALSADGEVYPCRHHVGGASIGNALRDPFVDIWNGPRMRAFRAQLREECGADEVCAACRHEDAPLDRVFGAVARVVGVGRGRGDR